MKRFILLLALILITVIPVWSRTEVVKSPDGKIAVYVSDNEGKAEYYIELNGVRFLEKSPLGLILNIGDYCQDLSISATRTESINDNYYVPTIKRRNVNYVANKLVVTFNQGDYNVFDVVFQVSNTDAAFCYYVYKSGNKEFEYWYSAVVEEEKTGFNFCNGTTTFLCPQTGAMGGFAGTSPSYETHYTVDDKTGTNGWGEGFTIPCLFKNSDKGWILISETGTDGDYCGCHIKNVDGNNYQIAFPNQRECNGNGTVNPGVTMPFSTPWRTITLGTTPAAITETTVAWDLVSERYKASCSYQYGCGSWSWIIGMDQSCNFDEQKRYIDFSAAMGYKTVLIDALWDVQIGYDKIKQLSEYGASKGVGLFLWYNSNGYWNHAPQSPRGVLCKAYSRKAEFQKLKQMGIRGIKVDFFGGDKQMMIQFYEDILSDADDANLEVIFHGCTLPRGWERMYPNFVACEAVRASENLHFGQSECDREAFDATILPFTRNTVGSMDFGGSTLNKFYNADNKNGSQRKTSDVFALATAILFQSPVQHFALAPNNLTDAPSWAIDFMKGVPTVWDDIKFIDGYPGKFVIIERKSGDKRFIVGINAQKESLNKVVKVDDFEIGSQIKLYTDDASLKGSVKTIKVNKKKEISVIIPCNGGFVIEQ